MMHSVIFFRGDLLELGQYYDCPRTSKVTLNDMGKTSSPQQRLTIYICSSSETCFIWNIRLHFQQPWECIPQTSLIARFMGPTWAHLGPTGPRWAPRALLSGMLNPSKLATLASSKSTSKEHSFLYNCPPVTILTGVQVFRITDEWIRWIVSW